MKNYYFLSGLPRAGNTVLGSLLNEDPQINLTANSVLPDVLFGMNRAKQREIYRNFPDQKSFNNIYNNVFENYFKDHKADNIICRGPWGTRGNLNLLNPIIPRPKFIVLYRPVVECLASFVNLIKPKNVEAFAKWVLRPRGTIGHARTSIQNIISSKQDHIVIHYDDLTKEPEKELKKIYKYLNLKYSKRKLIVKDQFKSNNIFYDDTILEFPLHKLKLGEIKKFKYSINELLPKEVIEYCNKMDINEF